MFSCCKSDIEDISILDIVRRSSADDITRILDTFIKSNRLNELLSLFDVNGNNIIHIAVNHQLPAIVQLILSKLGPLSKALVLQVNNTGKTPLYYADRLHEEDGRSAMINLILPVTLSYSIKSLSAQLNLADMLKEHPESRKSAELSVNMSLGCEALNQCRAEIKDSETHLQANTYSASKKEENHLKILSGRIQRASKTVSVDAVAKQIVDTGIANCGEYSFLTINHLLKMSEGKPHRIELVSISNGDHYFVVMDRNEKSNINRPETWGNNAIVIDTWAGEVYPAHRIYIQLMNYVRYQNYNLAVAYKAGYHTLESKVEFNSDNKLNSNCLLNFRQLKGYSSEEIAKAQKLMTTSAIQVTTVPQNNNVTLAFFGAKQPIELSLTNTRPSVKSFVLSSR